MTEGASRGSARIECPRCGREAAAVDHGPTRVSGMKKRDGEWRVKTPEEFVAAIRRAVGDG